jgi:hypothetical protein
MIPPVTPPPLLSPQLMLDVSGEQGRRLLLCCAKEVERGVRVALFTVPRMFRLDAIVEGETVRAVVRNLSRGSLTLDAGHHTEAGTNLVLDGAGDLFPSMATVAITIATGAEVARIDVAIGALLLADRGVMRIAAQATVSLTAADAGATATPS